LLVSAFVKAALDQLTEAGLPEQLVAKTAPTKPSESDHSNNNNSHEYPNSSSNNNINNASLVQSFFNQNNGQPMTNQMNPLFNQQAAMAALSASLFSQGNQSTDRVNSSNHQSTINSNSNNNLMTLFNNPQLFMAMAAAASTLNGSMNGKKPPTLPVPPATKYPMSNFNNNN